MLERQHQEIAMVIDRADRDTGAAHDTLVRETRYVAGNVSGDRGMVEISDGDQRRQGYRTGMHAAVATNTHIDFKVYVFLGKFSHVCVQWALWVMVSIEMQLVLQHFVLPTRLERACHSRFSFMQVEDCRGTCCLSSQSSRLKSSANK